MPVAWVRDTRPTGIVNRMRSAPTTSTANAARPTQAPGRLAIAIRAGDRHAFGRFVHDIGDPLVRHASALVGPSAAPDLVQEVLAAVWTQRRSLPETDGQLRSYVFGALINRARMHHREAGRRRRRETEAAQRIAVERTGAASRGPVETAAGRQVWEIAMALPTPVRDVIALRFGLGLTIEETATSLAIPTGTAATRLRHGLSLLRQRLDPTAFGHFAVEGAALSALLSAALNGSSPVSAAELRTLEGSLMKGIIVTRPVGWTVGVFAGLAATSAAFAVVTANDAKPERPPALAEVNEPAPAPQPVPTITRAPIEERAPIEPRTEPIGRPTETVEQQPVIEEQPPVVEREPDPAPPQPEDQVELEPPQPLPPPPQPVERVDDGPQPVDPPKDEIIDFKNGDRVKLDKPDIKRGDVWTIESNLAGHAGTRTVTILKTHSKGVSSFRVTFSEDYALEHGRTYALAGRTFEFTLGSRTIEASFVPAASDALAAMTREFPVEVFKDPKQFAWAALDSDGRGLQTSNEIAEMIATALYENLDLFNGEVMTAMLDNPRQVKVGERLDVEVEDIPLAFLLGAQHWSFTAGMEEMIVDMHARTIEDHEFRVAGARSVNGSVTVSVSARIVVAERVESYRAAFADTIIEHLFDGMWEFRGTLTYDAETGAFCGYEGAWGHWTRLPDGTNEGAPDDTFWERITTHLTWTRSRD